MSRRGAARRALLAAGMCTGIACDVGPLGGTALTGERVDAPVADWSFLAPRYTVDIETEGGGLLPAAHPWIVVKDGRLWLYALSTGDLEPPWIGRLRDDARVTIGADGRLHPARAVWVQDPAELEPLLPLVLRKYHMVEAASARFAPPSERFPGTQIRHWFFRIEPR